MCYSFSAPEMLVQLVLCHSRFPTLRIYIGQMSFQVVANTISASGNLARVKTASSFDITHRDESLVFIFVVCE